MTTEFEPEEKEIEAEEAESHEPAQPTHRKVNPIVVKSGFILLVFAFGLGSGYFMGWQAGHQEMGSTVTNDHASRLALMEQVNPPKGYKISTVFGDVGPRLVAAGAIDMQKFISLYKQQNQPLTNEQMDILTKETASSIVITPQNAYFLLNFFWALGLTNDNPILTEGQMMKGGKVQAGGYASTGGWTIGAKAPGDLLASTKIMTLTDEQQARLDEVSASVYRPCCDNPTHFPDCNHGMAMLGLLELMASQNASADDMYKAAKYVNAFWYPQQTLEVATLFKAAQKVDFAEADAKTIVSQQFSSGSGFQAVHQYLAQNGLLEQAPSSGGSCGVR